MSIVRSLLIKVGFVTDRGSVNETNRAISGFKTRFAVAASLATYAFSKIAQFFGDIASATLDASELANTLGISLKQLTAIQNAAQKVGRLDFKQTGAAFSTLNKMLNGFKTQADNTLASIAEGLKFKLSREDSPEKVFQNILTGLNQIASSTERIRLASNIFGDELGPKIAALSLNIDKFNESVDDFQGIGEKTEESLESLRNYEEAVNSLGRAWNAFTISVSATLFPVLEKIINYLEIASDFYRNLFSFDLSGLKKTAEAGSKLLDPLFEKTGLNKVSNFFKEFWGGETLPKMWDKDVFNRIGEYIENKPGYKYEGFLAPPNPMNMAPITNNIDISVPPGTTEEQADYISNNIKQAIEDLWEQQFRQIQYNNPRVE
jgi:uncharacterized protein YozE (UPF0346 family)